MQSIARDLPPPSPWVMRFSRLFRENTRILDLACGGGRHAIRLAARGYQIVAADRNTAPLYENLSDAVPRNLEIREVDLETSTGWTFGDEKFGGIIITNYLHRPIMADIADALTDEGVLIYETFAAGNEKFGKPSNPDFLLRPGELWDCFSDRLSVIAYEDGIVTDPRPARIQRICAVGKKREGIEIPPCQAAAAPAPTS